MKNVSLIHRNRESNHIADSLAKEGVSHHGFFRVELRFQSASLIVEQIQPGLGAILSVFLYH